MGDASTPPGPKLSIVLPVHNEQGNLEILHAELDAVIREIGVPTEVIFVNDGSTDDSSDILDRLRREDPRIRVFDHDKNHGLTAALDCGFRNARGELVAMLDADLQNPPSELAKLYAVIDEADVVVGWRRDRNDTWFKRVQSRIANRYRNWRTRETIHDTGCGLKLFRREVLARVKLWDGMHRFLPTLARMEGFRVAEVPVAHRQRSHGTSHYGMWNRLWKGLRDVRTVRWMWANRLTYVETERPPYTDDDA